jgi:hypothetical protein
MNNIFLLHQKWTSQYRIQAKASSKSLPADTTVGTVYDSGLDAYHMNPFLKVIFLKLKKVTLISEGIRSGSKSDSSSEEIVLQTQQGRGWKRICSTQTKCELGWKGKQPVQKPSFSDNPGINSNFNINEHSSPFKIFQVFFNSDLFTTLCEKTNSYKTQ